MTTEFIMIYTTVPSREEGARLSQILLEERLAACANIQQEHQSLYWWDGQINNATEFGVLLKTRSDLFEDVEQRIKDFHSYDCPCIVAWPLEKGHQPFLNWIKSETK